MALIKKQRTVDEILCKCDRCGMERKAKNSLNYVFSGLTSKGMYSVPGIENGWLCYECSAAIIKEWYTKNKPSMKNASSPNLLRFEPEKKGMSRNGVDANELPLPELEETDENPNLAEGALSESEIDSLLERPRN